jgi:hypothetical protein
MGHASIKTTYQTYGHLLPNHLEHMVARLEPLHAGDGTVVALPPQMSSR